MFFPRCLDRQRGMVSREYWGESLQESVRVVKENKSWSEPVPGFQIVESGTFHYLNASNRIRVDEPIRWLKKKTRVDEPDSGEWHFQLSERPKQAMSWWANKMVEQKEALLLEMKTRLYKHRTSVYCWLVWSKLRAPCLLRMRKTALLQR